VKQLLARIYSNKSGTKRHQNLQSLLNQIFTVHITVSNIYMQYQNNIKYKKIWTHSAIVKRYATP